MSHEEILNQAKLFFEEEYDDTENCIKRNYSWNTPKEFVDGSVKRCLGVAQFVQHLGVAYEDINPIYMDYKEKLEKLLTNE